MELVLADSPAPHVRRITLNRPDQLNAVTAELCLAVHDELASAAFLQKRPTEFLD